MASARSISFTVITPEHQVLEETSDAVTIPACDGELGVLYHRAPLMCELGIGQLRYRKDGRMYRVYVDGGFAQVYQDQVTVLTSHAVPAEAISDEMIADARQAVEAAPDAEARAQSARRLHTLQSLKSVV